MLKETQISFTINVKGETLRLKAEYEKYFAELIISTSVPGEYLNGSKYKGKFKKDKVKLITELNKLYKESI